VRPLGPAFMAYERVNREVKDSCKTWTTFYPNVRQFISIDRDLNLTYYSSCFCENVTWKNFQINLFYIHSQSDIMRTTAASPAESLGISLKETENTQWPRLPLCLARGTGVVSSNLSFRTRLISGFIPCHPFIHSLYFPYIHIQVKYQGCGNCQSSCIHIC